MTNRPRSLLDRELDHIMSSAAPAPDAPLSERIREVAGLDYYPDPEQPEAADSTPAPAPPPQPEPEPAAVRRRFDIEKWARRAALAFVAAGALLALVLGIAGPPAHAATAAPAMFGSGPCSAPLTYGQAVVIRTTGRVNVSEERRYYTSVILRSTGDQYRLVVDRGVGRDPISGIVNRVQHGATGSVNAPVSWGFYSRTGSVAAHVAGVDENTGRIFQVSC